MASSSSGPARRPLPQTTTGSQYLRPLPAPRLMFPLLLLLVAAVRGWRVCDVTAPPFGAHGDGHSLDHAPLQAALTACDEVLLPAGGVFLSGPLNLTSNQRLDVQGVLLASMDPRDYPLVAPVLGYGWSDDMNCFPPGMEPHKIVPGALRYASRRMRHVTCWQGLIQCITVHTAHLAGGAASSPLRHVGSEETSRLNHTTEWLPVRYTSCSLNHHPAPRQFFERHRTCPFIAVPVSHILGRP